MTIAADKMKDAPAWATRYETIEGDEGAGWFAHYLTDDVAIGTTDGKITGRAELVLDGSLYVVDHATDLYWDDPAEMRKLAAHLLNAAEAWEGVLSQAFHDEFAAKLSACMTEAGADHAALADRTEIDADRIDAILAAEVTVTMTEIALFGHVLNIDPSKLIPKTWRNGTTPQP